MPHPFVCPACGEVEIFVTRSVYVATAKALIHFIIYCEGDLEGDVEENFGGLLEEEFGEDWWEVFNL